MTEAKAAMLTEVCDVLDEMLDWALANRGTASEFVSCYTYRTGYIPPVIRQAKRALKAGRASLKKSRKP